MAINMHSRFVLSRNKICKSPKDFSKDSNWHQTVDILCMFEIYSVGLVLHLEIIFRSLIDYQRKCMEIYI